MSILKNWKLTSDDRLVGNVYGDLRFLDGTKIVTSRVVRLDLETGKVFTANNEYELGDPYDDSKSTE